MNKQFRHVSQNFNQREIRTFNGLTEDFSYEGLEPHFYILEENGNFYGFWNDKDDAELIEVITDDTVSIEERCRWYGESLEEIQEVILDSF